MGSKYQHEHTQRCIMRAVNFVGGGSQSVVLPKHFLSRWASAKYTHVWCEPIDLRRNGDLIPAIAIWPVEPGNTYDMPDDPPAYHDPDAQSVAVDPDTIAELAALGLCPHGNGDDERRACGC